MPLRKMEQGGKRDVEDGTGAVERTGGSVTVGNKFLHGYLEYNMRG